MSTIDASPTSASPLPEPWVGKSRNAKAQARHRAKRKAYIEQLEQTVAKLQTALALSAEDVDGLPTAQMKMRELKEENDSLRAEIRKLQYQPSASAASSSLGYAIPTRVPVQLHSPASSEEHLREPKRRKLSNAAMDDYISGNLQTYLAPADPVVDSMPGSNLGQAGARQMLQITAPTPILPPQVRYQQGIRTPQPSPADGPNMQQQPREALFAWPPLTTHQGGPNVSATHPSWPLPVQPPNHHRQRTSSGSSSSSGSGPAYLTTHTPVQMPLSVSFKQPSLSDHAGAYDPVPKAEDVSNYAQTPEAYALPSGLSMGAFESIASSESPQASTWPDRPWPFSTGRMQ